MHTLETSRAPFGQITQVSLRGEGGIGSRLILDLSLMVRGERMDEADDDRLLLSTTLFLLDGDLLLEDGSFIGALRAISPLPLAQGRGRQPASVALAVELSEGQISRLEARRAGGDLSFVAVLRGQAEHWNNALYDQDGYQIARVGDSGMSRVMQTLGSLRRLPLTELRVPVAVSAQEWGVIFASTSSRG